MPPVQCMKKLLRNTLILFILSTGLFFASPANADLEEPASEGFNYPIETTNVVLTETLWSMSYNSDPAPQLEITYPTAEYLGELYAQYVFNGNDNPDEVGYYGNYEGPVNVVGTNFDSDSGQNVLVQLCSANPLTGPGFPETTSELIGEFEATDNTYRSVGAARSACANGLNIGSTASVNASNNFAINGVTSTHGDSWSAEGRGFCVVATQGGIAQGTESSTDKKFAIACTGTPVEPTATPDGPNADDFDVNTLTDICTSDVMTITNNYTEQVKLHILADGVAQNEFYLNVEQPFTLNMAQYYEEDVYVTLAVDVRYVGTEDIIAEFSIYEGTPNCT